ncbi:DUF6296 family protein [Kitasatospora indigofera]|uniref:DUF6296 family protein n=1 Tax=Kitasatospora indigofera TaxID=67307 RepID=UPI00362B81F1
MSNDRYDHDGFELVFAAPAPGDAPDVVVVRRSALTGPGGHPVYLDATGIVCAEISDRGEARMLATGAHQRLTRPVRVRRAHPLREREPALGQDAERGRRAGTGAARPAVREGVPTG